MLKQIRQKNPTLTIKTPDPENFCSYGKLLNDPCFDTLIQALKKTRIPDTGNYYIPDEPSLHIDNIPDYISANYYAEMPIEIGYSNGHSHALNAFEYHQGNEINFFATDCILMLAHQYDIKDNQIPSSNAELFYFTAGSAIELYGTTLHFSAVALNQNGFRVGVILPLGTNHPLSKPSNDPTIWGRNKWLIAHPDSPNAKRGAYTGVTGENITITLLDE